MNKAFIIIGPESSGTRAVTKLFCLAGCFGNDTHNQPLDDIFHKNINLPDSPLVFRRSVPHQSGFITFDKIDKLFYNRGYSSWWVICLREYLPLYKSKIQQKRKGSPRDAQEAIIDEYRYIFSELISITRPFYLLSTSLLFNNPARIIKSLSEWSGLTFPLNDIKIQIYDADAKYHI